MSSPDVDAGLRRLDWRFLLPRPPAGRFEHFIVLGASAQVRAHVQELDLAARVTVGAPGSAKADGIAVLSGARVTPSQIAPWLLPGAAVYWEVDRRRVGSLAQTPGRLHRELQAVGLNPIGAYWVTPSHSAPRKWVPLDCPPAIRWYLDTFIAATLPHRVIGAALRLLAARPAAISGLVPCFSTIATAGPVAASRPCLLSNSRLPAVLIPDGARPLMLTSGRDDGSRVVMMLFAPGRGDPLVAVKTARAAAFNAHTEREQAALATIRESLSPELLATVPTPLGIVRSEDPLAQPMLTLESFAPGISLQASTARWGAPIREQVDDLRLAGQWIGRFHEETVTYRAPWSSTMQARWLEQPLAAYARAFGVTPAEERLFAATRAYGRTLEGSLPIVYQHNDFGPWNVVRRGSHLTVIDWEYRDGAEGRFGPALGDLLYFVTFWYAAARRADSVAGEVRAFVDLFLDRADRSVLARAAHREIDRYTERLQLGRELVPLLLVSTMVERALDQIGRHTELAEQPHQAARSQNRFLPFLGALSHQPDRLFARYAPGRRSAIAIIP